MHNKTIQKCTILWIVFTICGMSTMLGNNVREVAPSRILAFEKARNFRDLGGYQTKDGKQVKWGKIYRSDALHELSDRDLDLFRSLGIGTVCDLRSDHELEESPDRLPEGMNIRYLHLNVQKAVTQATGVKEEDWRLRLRSKSFDPNKMMIKGYQANTLYAAKAYAEVFDALLTSEKPVLFHCQAGKDRAGVGAALILLALGVDEATIVEDYMISGERWKGSQTDVDEMANKYGIEPAVLKELMKTRENWINAVFESIRWEYGDSSTYFEKALGLDEAKIKTLHNLYLEDIS